MRKASTLTKPTSRSQRAEASEPKTGDPDFSEADMHVPFDQVICVGDGASNLDSFGFVINRGGIAIAMAIAIAIDRSAS